MNKPLNGASPAMPKADPLRIVSVGDAAGVANGLVLQFNRSPTNDEVASIASLPPSPQIALQLGEMVRRAMTSEIIARLCRVYVLSGVLRSEGPEVTKWMRRYIDGDKDLGPLGAPMPWPDGLLETATMLREWGFERSPNGYVARAGTHATPADVKPS